MQTGFWWRYLKERSVGGPKRGKENDIRLDFKEMCLESLE
jgi:hypothetical protein